MRVGVIHIIDTHTVPTGGEKTTTNCGLNVRFIPKKFGLDDPRVCTECLRIHNRGKKAIRENKYCFLVMD
jgi:hypothetical protein